MQPLQKTVSTWESMQLPFSQNLCRSTEENPIRPTIPTCKMEGCYFKACLFPFSFQDTAQLFYTNCCKKFKLKKTQQGLWSHSSKSKCKPRSSAFLWTRRLLHLEFFLELKSLILKDRQGSRRGMVDKENNFRTGEPPLVQQIKIFTTIRETWYRSQSSISTTRVLSWLGLIRICLRNCGEDEIKKGRERENMAEAETRVRKNTVSLLKTPCPWSETRSVILSQGARQY